jgi:hypothetical protein
MGYLVYLGVYLGQHRSCPEAEEEKREVLATPEVWVEDSVD